MSNNLQDIKLMCIGDSITNGLTPGSYRKFLYHNLISKGYKIKMVGVLNNSIAKYTDKENPSNSFEYQDDNCGFSGYTTRDYKERKGLLEIMQKTECLKLNPDIIILLIGTNHIMDNIDYDFTINTFIDLIEYILNNINKNTMVFVGTIPDIDPNNKIDYTWFNNYRTENVDDKEVQNIVNNYVIKFNNKMKEIIEDFRTKNQNIKVEDLNSVLKDFENLMVDGVHPNENGFKKMADFWTDIIVNYLNEINYKI